MSNDEQAVRQWFDYWMKATKEGDLQLARSLIADDAVFLVPGRSDGQGEFRRRRNGRLDLGRAVAPGTEEHRAVMADLKVTADYLYASGNLIHHVEQLVLQFVQPHPFQVAFPPVGQLLQHCPTDPFDQLIETDPIAQALRHDRLLASPGSRSSLLATSHGCQAPPIWKTRPNSIANPVLHPKCANVVNCSCPSGPICVTSLCGGAGTPPR